MEGRNLSVVILMMKNNVFGIEYNLKKKIIYRRIIFCVLLIVFTLILNIVILNLRHILSKNVSFILNVVSDVICFTSMMIYFDFMINKEYSLLKLFSKNKMIINGEIESIDQTTIIYNKIDCYIVTINQKKYYSPVNSKVNLEKNKNAKISIVKGIILEVDYE